MSQQGKKVKKAPVRKKKKQHEQSEQGWIVWLAVVFLALFLGGAWGLEPLLQWAKENGKFPYLTHKVERWTHLNSLRKFRPEGYSVFGIDISHYQQEIDWLQLQDQNVAFVFMKATEGEELKDKYFKKHWSETYRHGIMRGAYHFFLPSKDAKKQAASFIQDVKLEYGDLPPVLDVEVTNRKSSKEIREGVKVWLDEVENHYGIKPVIYTSYSFYHTHLAGHFDEYPLWVAHYSKAQLEKTEKNNWVFWQHSDKGKLKGIKGMVDCNVFYGSLDELEELCYMPKKKEE